MKEKGDLIRGWLRKALSDTTAMEASLNAGALDAACFHAQQAAEKYLKSFLIHAGRDFPFTHNLSKLAELCSGVETAFHSLAPLVAPLTPYAVELRYDEEFWPSPEAAQEARTAAVAVRDFVLKRLPEEMVRDIA